MWCDLLKYALPINFTSKREPPYKCNVRYKNNCVHGFSLLIFLLCVFSKSSFLTSKEGLLWCKLLVNLCAPFKLSHKILEQHNDDKVFILGWTFPISSLCIQTRSSRLWNEIIISALWAGQMKACNDEYRLSLPLAWCWLSSQSTWCVLTASRSVRHDYRERAKH